MSEAGYICKCGHSDAVHLSSYPAECKGMKLSGIMNSKISPCKCRHFDMDLNTYYNKVYLPLHSKTGTKLWHFIGLQMTVLFVLLCVAAQWWWALLLTPFIVYPFAWMSHKYIEQNQPAAFKNPVYAKLSDLRMCLEMLTGDID